MSSNPVPSIEIGSLTASSPEGSQFIGSSSGVFFANTVHRAFARSRRKGAGRENELPSSGREAAPPASVENFIAGNESPPRSQATDGRASDGNSQGFQAQRMHEHILGVPPSQEVASDLIMVYFRTWHPLFPFLYGPSFLKDVEAFYSTTLNHHNGGERQQICHYIISQCIFNIAALERRYERISDASQIESSSSLLSLLGIVATKYDILGIQALLAMQLFLISTLSLRAASTVGGVLTKLLFHGGFHRCPLRYSQISQHDCEIRKRIFWCVYATDRYLSQALGHPLGMQDSDVDVCIPGAEEHHQPVPQSGQELENEVRAHLPQGHPDSIQTSSESGQQGQERPSNGRTHSTRTTSGEDILANYVSYFQITGRALELFHKSLHTRSVDHQHITLLTSDVHSWWNNLPQHLQESTSDDIGPSFSAFFNILYQSLIILINRPFLSLDPSAPEFRLSLQTCAGASRQMLLMLRDHVTAFSWPGILSGTWMAGLVLAFGCELNLYPCSKGMSEIEICLELLRRMSNRFSTAKHCHTVLGILLEDLHDQFDSDSQTRRPATANEGSQKRRRLDKTSSAPSNRLDCRESAQLTPDDLNTITPAGQTHLQLGPTVSSNQAPFIQTSYNHHQQDPSSLPWPDSMMPGDVGDVFSQVSWEALFQGDGSGWEEWETFSGL